MIPCIPQNRCFLFLLDTSLQIPHIWWFIRAQYTFKFWFEGVISLNISNRLIKNCIFIQTSPIQMKLTFWQSKKKCSWKTLICVCLLRPVKVRGISRREIKTGKDLCPFCTEQQEAIGDWQTLCHENIGTEAGLWWLVREIRKWRRVGRGGK